MAETATGAPTPVGAHENSAEEFAVTVKDLVKRYPKAPTNAVDGVSFSVRQGEVFGLLGPNGAGKTTTIGILTTRVLATSGIATVGGIDVTADPVNARIRLAVVSQRPNLDRSLDARRNLLFHARYHGIGRSERNRRADELLEQFGLTDKAKAKVNDLSGGQAQRLMIARAMMHAPRVLFLDEPSTGLDPQARLFVWDRIAELKAAGTTVLITTHDMDEAAELSDRVGIMDHGKLLRLDTPTELTRSLPGKATLELDLRLSGPDTAADVAGKLATLDGIERAEHVQTAGPAMPPGLPPGMPAMPMPPAGGPDEGADAVCTLRLYVRTEAAALLGPVATLLAAREATLLNVRMGQPSLEDVFIELTGRGLR